MSVVRSPHVCVFVTCLLHRRVTVTGLAPTSGPQAGGDLVRVQGSGFSNVPSLSCRFGHASVRAHFISEELVTCSTPPATGTVPVGVLSDHAAEPQGSQLAPMVTMPFYMYASVFRITAVVPAHGPRSGVIRVVLFGINLPQRSTCVFSDTLSGPSTWISPNLVLCSTPPLLPRGPALVSLRASEEHVVAHGVLYTISPDPVIFSIHPAQGPALGGTILTIAGQHFGPASVCRFMNAIPFRVASSVQDASRLFCVSPRAPPNSNVLTVTIGSMQSDPQEHLDRLSSPVFRYHPPCRIDIITPSAGPEAGGSIVRVVGANFIRSEETLIFFGTSSIRAVALNSTMVRAKLPLIVRLCSEP